MDIVASHSVVDITIRRDCRSIAAALKLPRRLDGILDRRAIAVFEIGDDHHVPDKLPWHVERPWILAQERLPVAELRPNHQMCLVKLAGHQPAVIAPLGKTATIAAAHSVQGFRTTGDLIDLHTTMIP
jgi:hypothetical protein